jgi:hypothetical protein
VFPRFSFALGFSLCAALAVHLSFGAAFVDNAVGYASTAYVAALSAALLRFPPETRGLVGRWPVRVALGVVVGVLGLWVLRGPALITLPLGSYVTTGHSPFVAFPFAALLTTGLFEALLRATSKVTRCAPVPTES